MATRKQLLQYVKNTAGGATVENFEEDWAPIGHIAWMELRSAELVFSNSFNRIQLTPAGEAKLEELNKEQG